MTTNFVFLHGGGQGSWIWDETVAALKLLGSDRLDQLLALDIPGCGRKREQATKTLSVSDILDSLLGDIDAAGIGNAILVGHSQAGTILPLLAKAKPDLFQHIVFISCLAPVGNQTALNWRTEMPDADSAVLNKHPHGSRDFYRQMFCNDMAVDAADAFLDKLGRDQWPPSSYEMSGWDYDHLADHSSTYVLCERDQALLPIWQEMFAERLKVKETLRFDAGHQVMNTQPEKLAEMLLEVPRSLKSLA